MKALIVSLESFQKGEIPEEVKKYIMSTHGNLFTILDESSKIKTNNPCAETKKSKRTQAIKRLGAIGDRCILTGTFMSKSPCNAYDQMNFLCPNFFSESMFEFSEKYEIKQKLLVSNRNPYMAKRQNVRVLVNSNTWKRLHDSLVEAYTEGSLSYNSMVEAIASQYGISANKCDFIRKHKEYTPFCNLNNLWNRIGDVCMQVKREDLFDLPPKIYRTITIKLTAEQKKLYMQLQNERCTEHILVENALSLYIRFQDICNGYEPIFKDDNCEDVELINLKSNPKLEALVELVDSIGSEQIVIWCSRTKLLYDSFETLEEIGYSCGIYDGKIGTETRNMYYNQFRNKEIQILIVNQASGAYGLDGLKAANYAIYLCNSYSVEQRQQSEDRIYRGEVKNNKFIFDITCKGTCEDRVTQALKQGKELLNSNTASSDIFKLKED